MIISMH